MSTLFSDSREALRLLDAGAGAGTLTAAFVEDACSRTIRPRRIEATAYDLKQADFVAAGVEQLRGDLFAPSVPPFNRAILNPPYRKVRSDSPDRALLRAIGVETSNLYAGFLAIVIGLLAPLGELVAITPRSFCNGPYFKPFRRLLLNAMTLNRIHVFEARDRAFSDDEVLQENIIFGAIKGAPKGGVVLSSTQALNDDTMTLREAPYEQVVHPNDPERVIHIAMNELASRAKDRVAAFEHTLDDIGIGVSTGRVVDIRARENLRAAPGPDTVPLIYPRHFHRGVVRWPVFDSRKPDSIVRSSATEPMLLPAGSYVLVKRFSVKGEPRRVVAAVCDPGALPGRRVAFEKHLNYYHMNSSGLPFDLARGLALYLNSTLINIYFRQFSGHTQVNAADLRMLRYPSRDVLQRLGERSGIESLSQREIDSCLEEEMRRMADNPSANPVAAKQKFDEALEILRDLDLPRGQLNERSALTLLALIGLQPETP
jgi:adenine-specific DNA-methyltransferase